MKKRQFLTCIAAVAAISLPVLKSAWAQTLTSTQADFINAVKNDDARHVKTALERNVDPNTKDANGQCALSLALQYSATRVADILIAHKRTNVNYLNKHDESPLMFAAVKGLLPQAKALIARDAYVNKTGWTPLHYACSQTDLAMVVLMIDNHAYIDASSPNETTPLMMAVGYGTDEQVQYLIEQGADVTLKNQHGLSAYDFAVRSERKKTAEMILQGIKATQPTGW